MQLLVSCSYDDTLKVWVDDEDDWFCSETLSGAHGSTVWDASFEHKAGELLASCSEDGSVAVWDYKTPALKPSSFDPDAGNSHNFTLLTQLKGVHPRTVYSLDWAYLDSAEAKRQILATGCADDAVRIISFDKETKAYEVLGVKSKAHTADVNCVRWCPTDPTLLASAGDDNLIHIWRIEM